MIDKELLLSFIREDAPFGDITSDTVIGVERCDAVVSTRSSGIVAGLDEATILCSLFGITAHPMKQDGENVSEGDVLLLLSGRARDILLVERTILNIIGRMSGISSLTRRLADLVSCVDPLCRIASTRKTAPGLRSLDKKAVVIGGGDSHRFSLSDGILIKDNHLALISIEDAVTRARERSIYQKIEVEAGSCEQALRAAVAGADIVMLDNMPPDAIRHTLQELTKRGLREHIVIELSGGITEHNIASYAGLGADVISLGFLTHSVTNLDISLDILGSQAEDLCRG